MLTILQGDALSVPISIKLNGIEVTTADIQAVKVTTGGIEKRYPGEITYDSTDADRRGGWRYCGIAVSAHELVGNYFVEVI